MKSKSDKNFLIWALLVLIVALVVIFLVARNQEDEDTVPAASEPVQLEQLEVVVSQFICGPYESLEHLLSNANNFFCIVGLSLENQSSTDDVSFALNAQQLIDGSTVYAYHQEATRAIGSVVGDIVVVAGSEVAAQPNLVFEVLKRENWQSGMKIQLTSTTGQTKKVDLIPYNA